MIKQTKYGLNNLVNTIITVPNIALRTYKYKRINKQKPQSSHHQTRNFNIVWSEPMDIINVFEITSLNWNLKECNEKTLYHSQYVDRCILYEYTLITVKCVANSTLHGIQSIVFFYQYIYVRQYNFPCARSS